MLRKQVMSGGKDEQFKMSKVTIEVVDNYEIKQDDRYWGKARRNHTAEGSICETEPSWTTSQIGCCCFFWTACLMMGGTLDLGNLKLPKDKSS